MMQPGVSSDLRLHLGRLAQKQQPLLSNTVTEIAVIAEVSGTNARVKRQGQTVATRFLPLLSGVTVVVGDRVILQKPGADINRGYIERKV